MKMELKAGARLGRYELLTHMAKGGMADVWLARASGPVGFQKTLVIKTILPHLADDPEFVRMFINEAVIAAQLDHPNIVHIFDLGELDGSYFIAMEYIAGRSLRNVQRELHKSKRVPPPWFVLRSISSACEALYHAHNKRDARGKPMNLVHRDVSPENIMVSFTGETKVLDFGIAKVSSAVSKTRVGVVKGKYAYMAPEQIETVCDGGPLDARIDIYSLGVVMYELLTGRRPFRGANDLALLRQILSDSPEPPSSFCNWIPEPLSNLILKAMARAPSKRFSSAAELQNAIEEFLSSQGFHPTHLHVAAFMRSLFGEEAAESPPLRLSASSSEAAAPVAQPAEGKEESLAIDVSILLEDDEVQSAEQQQDVPRSEAAAAGRGASHAAVRASSRPARASARPPVAPKPPDAPKRAPGVVTARADSSDSGKQRVIAPSPPARKGAASSVAAGIPPVATTYKPPTILPGKSRPPARPAPKDPPAGTARAASPLPAAPGPGPAAGAHGPFSAIVSRAAMPAAAPRVSDSTPDAPVPVGASASDAGQQPASELKSDAVTNVAKAPAPVVAMTADPHPVAAALPSTGAVTGAVANAPPPPEPELPQKGDRSQEHSTQHEGAAPAVTDGKETESGEIPSSPNQSDTGKHVWDRLMARVRELKSSENSEEHVIAEGDSPKVRQQEERADSTSANPEAVKASTGAEANPDRATEPDSTVKSDSGPKHLWDVLVERARDERGTSENEGGTESAISDRQEVRPVSSPDLSEHRAPEIKLDLKSGRAREAFERGLERLRRKDLDGALEEWSRAVELEPDNRAYQSNVRMLKKQVAARRG